MGGIFQATSARPSAPIGRLIRNTACQPKASVSKPPSGGPLTGPSMAGMVSQAMAESISSLRTCRSSRRRATGTIIAPPRPCRLRAATSSSRLSARAQSSEARTKTQIAAMKTRFAPKRSATQPETGMNTVSATR